ncbi:MAG: DUF423 domain-containing protein [Fimbriimonadaceae bacterium]|nr:DUF423 domain-containing protein [Fimbriimonadaceae bacterium]QYK58244.1 MAG: DUF423 domain-containing protein [Fimbriimonadaceae bacterium]
MNRGLAATALISLAVATALGAFGAHALKSMVSAAALETFRTGHQYHAWGSAALLAGSLIPSPRAWPWLWTAAAGIAIFSASLYGLVLGGPRFLGAIAPIGGSLMIAGWALAGWHVLKGPHQTKESAPR